MSFLKKKFDFVLLGLSISGFLLVASQRLGTVPIPDTDESYMLQASYEMLYRGHLGWPMLRFVGGNIETNLHSFMPLHFLMQSGFLKVFGWGLLQGRVFNLILSALMLVMLYLIARKLFDWRTGLIAVMLVVCDVTFLGRSRYLRNDYGAAMFALLAFYLYEIAERRKTWRWYLACGLAAGASLMTHTAGFYMVLAIPILMLMRRGWRVFTAGALYQYWLGALAVSAYEIISDVLDYRNVILQNRGDRLHFGLLNNLGWWRNVRREPRRYYHWYSGHGTFSDVPLTLLHLIQLLALLGVCYLIVRLFVQLRRGNAMSEPRVRVLAVMAIAVVFFAVAAGQKAIYYMAHLAPLFALCGAILLADAIKWIGSLRSTGARRLKAPKFVYAAAVAIAITVALGGSWLLFDQTRSCASALHSPDNANFEEFKTAIRSIVPEGVCPIAIREPVVWLAFPEHDLCFASIQPRSRKEADIDGKEFAMIVSRESAHYWVDEIASVNHYLLGSLTDTPYGSFEVYYTGTDPGWRALEAKEYWFFGRRRGYVSGDDLARAREIWSADAAGLKQRGAPGEVEGGALKINATEASSRTHDVIELCAVELKPNTIYQASIEAATDVEAVSLAILDATSGAPTLDQRSGKGVGARLKGLFKSGPNERFKVGVRPPRRAGGNPIKLTRISIREVRSDYL